MNLELILYDPILVIDTDNVSVSEMITFDYNGTQANGVIDSIATDRRSMTVYTMEQTSDTKKTVKINADDINNINFAMMKWADYGFENIETTMSRAITGAYLAKINYTEFVVGSAF